MKTKRKWSKEEAEERLKPLSDKHQRIYYVYVCKVDGVPKYVGMGKGGRWKHCVSGKSSCSELNRNFQLVVGHVCGIMVTLKTPHQDTTQERSHELVCHF